MNMISSIIEDLDNWISPDAPAKTYVHDGVAAIRSQWAVGTWKTPPTRAKLPDWTRHEPLVRAQQALADVQQQLAEAQEALPAAEVAHANATAEAEEGRVLQLVGRIDAKRLAKLESDATTADTALRTLRARISVAERDSERLAHLVDVTRTEAIAAARQGFQEAYGKAARDLARALVAASDADRELRLTWEHASEQDAASHNETGTGAPFGLIREDWGLDLMLERQRFTSPGRLLQWLMDCAREGILPADWAPPAGNLMEPGIRFRPPVDGELA